MVEFLNKTKLFQGVSSITIHKLCFEFIDIQKYRSGDIIYNTGETEKAKDI